MASSNLNNANRVNAGSLTSGMRSLLAHHARIQKCCTEVEYRSGILLLNPIGQECYSGLQTGFIGQNPYKSTLEKREHSFAEILAVFQYCMFKCRSSLNLIDC